MSASRPDEKMFRHQYILQDWDRKCLPQDEYLQFEESCNQTFSVEFMVTHHLDSFICNCGQYCLFD